ncbi:PadR family transcriptional regulator [Sphingosinicella sp. LHD-64]|uniref:PadR family transcriptional regulator n=1 Tax=Sphingosinicella sp. LHD-64 TaxID=3072139 RepID=UPI00280DE061|nr:PadR family transcriptional regulator [Sphingosinicella sp. LHD-64]MDQ8757313.1 PadR family transcriptional regulator [Sphingosinicella sp. LHD-64]
MSAVRLLVLGMVRMLGRAHGYAVHRELTSWQIDTWTSVKPASLYHALKQLAKEGKLRTAGMESSPEGPGRTVYEITAAGDVEFFGYLEGALRSIDIEELGAGFAFMQALPRARVLALLREQLRQTEAVRDDLKTMMSDHPVRDKPPYSQDLLGLWSRSFGANAEWSRSLIERLERGEYSFTRD